MFRKRFSFLFVVLVALSSVALIVSNIIAGKLWQAPFGLIFTTAVWLFPIVYILNDVIPECYGLKTAQKVIFTAFGLNALAVLFFYICLWLPAPVFWQNQAAFQTVLGFTVRLLIASFAGYLAGSNLNVWIMVTIKKLTHEKYLWVRTITSTIFGEYLDTLIFASIAFYGTMPLSALGSLILSMGAFKILYEVCATPLTYIVVNWVKKVEKET